MLGRTRVVKLTSKFGQSQGVPEEPGPGPLKPSEVPRKQGKPETFLFSFDSSFFFVKKEFERALYFLSLVFYF